MKDHYRIAGVRIGQHRANPISAANDPRRPQLPSEQKAIIDQEMTEDSSFAFSADDIAADLGIPSREVRDWTDEEIDLIWDVYVEQHRA